MWFFASVALLAAIWYPGFRRVLLISTGALAVTALTLFLAMAVTGAFR